MEKDPGRRESRKQKSSVGKRWENTNRWWMLVYNGSVQGKTWSPRQKKKETEKRKSQASAVSIRQISFKRNSKLPAWKAGGGGKLVRSTHEFRPNARVNDNIDKAMACKGG